MHGREGLLLTLVKQSCQNLQNPKVWMIFERSTVMLDCTMTCMFGGPIMSFLNQLTIFEMVEIIYGLIRLTLNFRVLSILFRSFF